MNWGLTKYKYNIIIKMEILLDYVDGRCFVLETKKATKGDDIFYG